MREECGLLLETIPVLKDLSKWRRQELCNVRTDATAALCGVFGIFKDFGPNFTLLDVQSSA